MTRAAIYVRVSTDRQEDEGTSLVTQESRSREYCDTRGYQIVETISDTWTGSQYRERPGLTRLRELVRGRQIDVVVAHAIDRLSRNQAHLYILAEEFTDHGCRLEFVTESFEDSAVGRFLRSAKAFAAEIEREKIAERMIRGKQARIQAGKFNPGCKAPYGYQFRDAEKTGLAVREDEAAIVRRVFAASLAGESIRQIAKELNVDGVPTPRPPGLWTQATVQRILRHPYYVGDAYGWLTTHGTSVFQWDRAIPYPAGTVPAIVDRSTWDTVQVTLRNNKERSSRNARYPEATLLRNGFAWCGYCGYMLSAVPWRRGEVFLYECGSRRYMTQRTCEHPSIRAHILDAAVWDAARQIITQPDLMRAALEELRRASPEPVDLASYDRILAEVGREQANLTRALAALDDPDLAEPVIAQLRQAGARKKRVQADRDAAARRVADWEHLQAGLTDLLRWPDRYGRNLDALSWSEKRTVLDLLGIRAYLWRADHRPRFRIVSTLDLAGQQPVSHCEPDRLQSDSERALVVEWDSDDFPTTRRRRWAERFDACIICGGTDAIHWGRGRCQRCYHRLWKQDRRE